MSDSTDVKAPASKTDIWIALGVIGCLALGASVTFVLSSHHNADNESSRSKEPVRGVPIVSRGTQTATSAATAPATPGSAVATQTVKVGDGDFMTVTFDTLSSYYYEIPNPEQTANVKDAIAGDDKKPDAMKRPKDQVPAPVKALNGKKVSVQGFMIPLKLDKGATKEFLLVKDQSVCCWGRVPRMNEWVSIKMTGDKTTKFIPDQPVTIFGVLQVGEEFDKGGEVQSLYRLDADDVAGPLDL
jgi:hypothetical protein